MNFLTLRDMVGNGYCPPVRFKNDIRELNSYFEPGMMATLDGVVDYQNNHSGFVFNVSDYKENNLTFETPNFYDANGTPRLTATEAKLAPCTRLTLFFMYKDEVDQFLEIIQDNYTVLFKLYQQSKSPVTYVRWLEQQLINT